MKDIIRSVEDLVELSNRIRSAEEPVAVDTETSGLFPMEDKVVGFSLAFTEDEGYYIPANHRNSPNVPFRLVQQLFMLLAKKRLIFHNARFDTEMVYTNYGIKLPIFADTQAMAYIACFPRLALKEIMADFFNEDTKEFEELLEDKYGKQWKAKGYTAADLDPEDISDYAIKDPRFTYKLFNALKDEMKNYSSIWKLELNIIPMVAQMNLEGLYIDKDFLRDLSAKAKERVGEYVTSMRAVAGPDFEPNSSRQVSNVIFNKLGLPVMKKTKKGAPSADAEVMEQLQYMHPFCKDIMEYRSMSKFISGYLDKIPDIVDYTGLLYANFKSIGADSGRFTCPGTTNWQQRDVAVNLQNQPVNEEFEVRKAYVAPEGYVWVKADFSQIEYRIMNNLAGETNAIDKFKAGADFHSITARMMLDLPDDHVLTRDERQIGKVLNFGISYGMHVSTVAKMTGHTEAEAQKLYDKYFAALPRLEAFIEYCKNTVRKKKIAKTAFGRVRKLEWEGLPSKVAEDTIKKGFNTTVQGTSADCLKMAMLRVKDRVLDKYGRDIIRLVLTVHDELDFYVREDMLQELLPQIKAAMEIPVPDNWAPLVCDIEYGPTWAEVDHVDYKPTSEEYAPDKFEGWGKVLPEKYQTYLTNENYCVQW